MFGFTFTEQAQHEKGRTMPGEALALLENPCRAVCELCILSPDDLKAAAFGELLCKGVLPSLRVAKWSRMFVNILHGRLSRLGP